ncbi:MAG: T9SS type A sorting domain-containing protein [Candidatus Poribacteria bacterium]|nr:T9SS type A sorting domain-containing protein [Candidatus Poribacteria bacterium]
MLNPKFRYIRKNLVPLSTILLILFCLETQAKPGASPYHQLRVNVAREVSFPSTTTNVGQIAVIQGNEHLVQPTNFFDLANSSLRFTPKAAGGYDVSSPDAVEFEAAFGQVLDLTDDDSRKIAIAFPFTFFGQAYTEVFVNSDGNLTFGTGDTNPRARDLQNFVGGPPRIGALYADLHPGAFTFGDEATAVEVKDTPGKITITWFNVPSFESYDSEITMQVVLFDTGVIDIRFESSKSRTGIVGLSPGGLNNALQTTLVDYSDDLPVEGSAGAIAEVFVSESTVNIQNVAREFYKSYGDDFDSLVLFTNFESDLDLFGVLAFAVPVKNDVLGIGSGYAGSNIFPIFDHTDDYGSQGRLRTFLVMKNLKVWSDNPLENVSGAATSTLSVVLHEFGHGWGVDINPVELLGRDFTHWNFFLHTGGSVMGGNDIRDNGDGTFTTLTPKDIFGPLDLYLMGLLRPEEVPPTFLVVNPHDIDIPPPFDDPYLWGDLQFLNPMADVSFRGEKDEVTIEGIVAANGERIPHADTSQKDFRVAFILLTSGESTPATQEIEKVQAVRRFWPPFFHRATNNLATMVSTLDGSVEDVVLPEEATGKLSFTVPLNNGLNIISPPLRPLEPFTAQSFMEFMNATMIISISDEGRFVSWTRDTPGDGFQIEGGRGYIVNTPNGGDVKFTGAGWSDSPDAEGIAAPSATPIPQNLWAFVVDGVIDGEGFPGPYHVSVKNLRTNNLLTTANVESGARLTLGFADMNRNPLVHVGDTLRLTVTDVTSGEPFGKIDKLVTLEDMRRAYSTLHSTLANLVPMTTQVLQNYPNPFNPETWIPYQLSENSPVSVSIYDPTGQLVRTLSLGFQSAGFYNSRNRAAYWDGKNTLGETVTSGVYFYHLSAGDYSATRRMLILK